MAGWGGNTRWEFGDVDAAGCTAAWWRGYAWWVKGRQTVDDAGHAWWVKGRQTIDDAWWEVRVLLKVKRRRDDDGDGAWWKGWGSC